MAQSGDFGRPIGRSQKLNTGGLHASSFLVIFPFRSTIPISTEALLGGYLAAFVILLLSPSLGLWFYFVEHMYIA
ncbi:hypothetical protein BCR34DRAFT_185609 [Clohesyomyces aquaticus]|uniref:Uncharacterized protein n=1 Tax=Clohesyomyces aquaticus TaxID=1231657 RepID=A0A1Y1YDQ4_9PLEO|nr:hypothetical protein BCR34DRAFT_185609 [Clohesyomyces aquaticus]